MNTLILSIETSTSACSVALHENGQLIGTQMLTKEGSHSIKLTVLIDQLLENCAVQMRDLSAIAVSNGPGSYTGLRIGLATAKGLCFGLDIPLIALPTLQVLAKAYQGTTSPSIALLPMLDARRMEVYSAIYQSDNFAELDSLKPVVLEENSYAGLADKEIFAFGNGSSKFEAICQTKNIRFLKSPLYPEAKYMGELALESYLNQKFENIVTLEPQYLKEFVGTQPRKNIL
ncbi:MAG: tRNA (adenosine(37)-N6)-threonylcarbamoyltransferase complex dimerization subunit type 1 TsaB [Aquirufa sp.]